MTNNVDCRIITFVICSTDFYNTDRGQHFDPNYWKSDSSREEIRTIEENCLGLISVLNYSISSNKSKKTNVGKYGEIREM